MIQNRTRSRILLTGCSGQVGGELRSILASVGEVIAPDSRELNLADPEAIRRVVRHVRPSWIVNPAAYTAVDRAESEPDLAYAINAEAPGVLGEEARALDATVIHYSTDYVFPGSGETPWRENDPTGPLGVYGASKLMGEEALAASGAVHFIFRTSWVYGATGGNFLRTILRLAAEKPVLRIVADQHGAPTWARNLAQLTLHTIRMVESPHEIEAAGIAIGDVGGLYHAADAGSTTWYGFAEKFLDIARRNHPERTYAAVQPISTEEYPTPARRPLNSRLDCSRLKSDLGYTMPEWQASLLAVMRELEP